MLLPIPKAFSPKSLYAWTAGMVWAAIPSGLRLLAPFSAWRSSRSPFAQGNTYSTDLKEQFRASTEQLNCS